MLLENDLKRIFKQLVNDDVAYVQVGESDITIHLRDGASKLVLVVPVFIGDDFIPKSVRECIKHKAPFSQSYIKTNFSIDEKHFRIMLSYVGKMEDLNHSTFKDLLEEFGWLADEWRSFLEDHGKQDLVHVHVKK